MFSLPFALFLLVSFLNLGACLAHWQWGYRLTKPLLLPLLLLSYLLAARRVDVLVILALLCGLAGDIALELPRPDLTAGSRPPLPLLIGLGAFLLGHVFYCVVFLRSIPAWPFLWTLLLALAAAGLLAAVLRSLLPHMGAMLLPGGLYLLVLIGMLFLACLSALTVPAPLRAPGALLFLLSDYILARSVLLQKKRFTDFAVMLTYLSAQLLLVASLLPAA